MATEDWTMSDESAGSDSELDFHKPSLYASSYWNSEMEAEMDGGVTDFANKLMPISSAAEDCDIEEKIEKAAHNLHDIFVESCCALYNDIRNALDELGGETEDIALEDLSPFPSIIGDLQKRQCVLMRQAEQLAIEVPPLADTVHLRVLAVGRAMEQLRIKQQETDQFGLDKAKLDDEKKSNESRHQQCSLLPAQFRKWLQCSEKELESIKEQIGGARTNLQLLHRLRANQQVLQLQIETEGGALYNSARQQLLLQSKSFAQNITKRRNCSSEEKQLERCRCLFSALEHRWWAIWLASLENLELIGHFIQQLRHLDEQCDLHDESDLEQGEPLRKRRRTSVQSSTTLSPESSPICVRKSKKNGANSSLSKINFNQSADESDTIPFTASEYESIRTPSSSPRLRKHQRSKIGQVAELRSEMEGEIIKQESSSASSSSMDSEQSSKNIESSQEQFLITGKIATEDGWSSNNSSRQLHDVGYSSGENSVYEALNNAASNTTIPKLSQQTLKIGDTGPLVRSYYYKTVPLDDAGVTDTESGPLLPDILLSSVPADNNPNLTDSLIVQVEQPSVSSDRSLDDFEEVMGIMDEQLFEEQLKLLRQGTQWRELKAHSSTPGRRLSSSCYVPHRPSPLLRRSFVGSSVVDKTSCDASSEESDEQRQTLGSDGLAGGSMCSSVNGATSLSSTLQRKRRFRRAGAANSPQLSDTLTSSKLENIRMDQSIYLLGGSDLNSSNFLEVSSPNSDFMSRSLNLSGSRAKGIIGRRKVLRRKMHRSASDNAGLSLAVNNSFQAHLKQSQSEQSHQQKQKNFVEVSESPVSSLRRRSNLRLWPLSPKEHTLKKEMQVIPADKYYQRRVSVESSDSATSTTIHESGDAHFEWDEYKDPCDVLMTPSIEHLDTPTSYSSNSTASAEQTFNKNSSISSKELFANSLIDEDFQSQLSAHHSFSINLVDMMLCESRRLLSATNQQFHKCRPAEMTQNQLVSVQNAAHENLKQLNTIVQTGKHSDSHMNMDQITQVEKLQNKWTKVQAKVVPFLAQPPSPFCSIHEEEKKRQSSRQEDGQIATTSEAHLVAAEPVSLHMILEEMKAQLNLLKLNGSTCLSIDEIQTVIATRKQILQTLLTYRDDLQQFAAEAQRQGLARDAKVEAEIIDLLTLVDLVEKSLSSIESSTVSLEKLRLGFECLCVSFKSLEAKIDKLATENDEVLDGLAGDFSPQFIFAKAIESELELCQERMNSLETMCNMLSTQLRLGVHLQELGGGDDADENKAPDLEETKGNSKQHDEFFSEFSRFRDELGRLKSKFNNVISVRINLTTSTTLPSSNRKRRRSPLTATIGTQSEISAAAFFNKNRSNGQVLKSALKSSVCNGTSPLTETKLKFEPRRRNLPAHQEEVEEQEPCLSLRLRTALRDSRMAQVFLGCALLISFGVLLVSWLVDDSHAIVNNWNWQFGPQLKYVRGPPPT